MPTYSIDEFKFFKMSTAKIVHLPNSNQITYHFHNKSSLVSVDVPWSELSGSNTNTDTSSLSPL